MHWEIGEISLLTVNRSGNAMVNSLRVCFDYARGVPAVLDLSCQRPFAGADDGDWMRGLDCLSPALSQDSVFSLRCLWVDGSVRTSRIPRITRFPCVNPFPGQLSHGNEHPLPPSFNGSRTGSLTVRVAGS